MRERLFNIVCGLGVLWAFTAIPVAAIWGDGLALTLVCIILLGPFGLFGVAFVLAFALSLILYGDPDRLVGKLFG